MFICVSSCIKGDRGLKRDELIKKAKEARQVAYAPYSNFKVGAALLTSKGKLYLGNNIENSSYSLTCCAERVAIFKAVSSGEQHFKKLAVVGNTKKVIQPCGACRQVMAEFFTEEVKIYLANLKGDMIETNISHLLPESFSLNDS